MKVILCTLLAALAVAGGSFAAGGAAPITARVLAAVDTQPFSVRLTKPGKTVVQSIKVAPGGSFGWHSHGAPVLVVMSSGALTVYDSSDPSCSPSRLTAGHGFFEPAHHVHLARNEGKTTATLYVVMMGLTKGAKPTIPAAEPASCAK
jgi:quercetin dioxygenase-like cupin family protein